LTETLKRTSRKTAKPWSGSGVRPFIRVGTLEEFKPMFDGRARSALPVADRL
jgi:hypothetical protein